jgi:hypothetical protein
MGHEADEIDFESFVDDSVSIESVFRLLIYLFVESFAFYNWSSLPFGSVSSVYEAPQLFNATAVEFLRMASSMGD